MRARLFLPFLAMAATMPGCTTAPTVAVALVAPPPPVAAPAAFAGYGNIVVPARLPDGGYATPNRRVSAAGAIWHLRAGLNVAALACRGPAEAALIAGYNGLLANHRAAFAAAYRTLGSEYGGVPAFDAAMTRLYNYYALPPAQAGLCAAAQQVLAEAALVPANGLPGFAAAALDRLDAPYVAVFTAQEQWLATRFAAPAPVLVARANTIPQLRVDPGVFAIR